MTSYLLLRNNMETGPFTFDELTAHSLRPTDLIWIEGQSTAWKYPTELDALQAFVTADASVTEPKWQTNQVITTSKGIFVALPPQPPVVEKPPVETTDSVELETRFQQPLEVLKERYELTKKPEAFQFRKTFSKPHTALWLGCVMGGLVFASVLIKKIVDTYDANTEGLTAGVALPINNRDDAKDVPEDDMYQNALTTEIVPVDTATLKPLKKAAPKVNLWKLVRLEANDYQVGMLGGIKNLRMLVVNKSAFILDKVSFQLDYLKPNGEVLKTENLVLKSVQPKSSKSLALPKNKRGVKINYHITDIKSKQGSDALLHL